MLLEPRTVAGASITEQASSSFSYTHAALQVALWGKRLTVNRDVVEHHGQPGGLEDVGGVLHVEVRMRLSGVARVAAAPDLLPSRRPFAGNDPTISRHQVSQEIELALGTSDNNEVVTKVGRERIDSARAYSRRVTDVVAHFDDHTGSRSEDGHAVAVIIVQPLTSSLPASQCPVGDHETVSVALTCDVPRRRRGPFDTAIKDVPLPVEGQRVASFLRIRGGTVDNARRCVQVACGLTTDLLTHGGHEEPHRHQRHLVHHDHRLPSRDIR